MLAGYHSGTIWALAAEYVSGAAWGRMLHIGCECWDGASVSLTQLSNASVQCSPSFHPSIPPPPLSSSNKWSFCSSVFAAVGWRASAGPSPKTSGLSWNCFLLHSIICGLSILLVCFFSYLFPSLLLLLYLWFCLFDYLSSRLFIPQYLCPHPTSRLMDFWNSLPPFCSLRTLMFNIFSPKTSLVFTPLALLPFHIVFHPILSTLADTLKNRFLVLCWDVFLSLRSRRQPEQKADKNKKMKSATTEMVNDDQSVHNYKQNTAQKRFIILSSLIMCTFFFFKSLDLL